jgi:hypothetical protein
MEKYDLKKHGVTQGLLTTFMRCRMEAANWMQGFEPLRMTQGLQFGTIFHAILERIYGLGAKLPPSNLDVLSAVKMAEKVYLKERGGRVGADEHNLLEANMSMIEAVAPGYFKYHKKDFGRIKWAELEQKFVVPSPVPGVNLTGRIDGAYWLGKELWLRENKTKSRIEEDVLSDTLTFDFQNSFYIYALMKKYKTWPKGILYDITRRPGEKLGKSESLVSYKRRIESRVLAEPEHYFLRYEISIPKYEHERFVGELQAIIKEFVAWVEGELPTYRNTSSCIQRFGPCRFLPICGNGDFSLFRKRDELFPELKR